MSDVSAAMPRISSQDCVTRGRTNATIDSIKRAVALHFQIDLIDMTSDRRMRRIAHPRQVAIWIARKATRHSLPAIGRHFGNRDHSTVAHAVAAVDARMAADPEFDAEVRAMLLPFRPVEGGVA